MNFKIFGISLLIACLPTLGCSNSSAPQSGENSDNPIALRILPLGDSITQANSDNKSYRFWLWQMLAEGSQPVDFVGSMDSNFEGNPDFPKDFDRNHEGHWGWRADEVLDNLPQWLELYDADISLIHLGTNDCLQNQAVDETLGEITEIIRLLQQDKPETDIILSRLGPSTWQNSSCLEQLNLGFETLQSQLDTPNSSVLLLPRDSGMDPAVHLYDGLHPNAEGEKRMAMAWLDAINALKVAP